MHRQQFLVNHTPRSHNAGAYVSPMLCTRVGYNAGVMPYTYLQSVGGVLIPLSEAIEPVAGCRIAGATPDLFYGYLHST